MNFLGQFIMIKNYIVWCVQNIGMNQQFLLMATDSPSRNVKFPDIKEDYYYQIKIRKKIEENSIKMQWKNE